MFVPGSLFVKHVTMFVPGKKLVMHTNAPALFVTQRTKLVGGIVFVKQNTTFDAEIRFVAQTRRFVGAITLVRHSTTRFVSTMRFVVHRNSFVKHGAFVSRDVTPVRSMRYK